MSQPCCMGLPAVSETSLFLHVFCCAMSQYEKAALEGGAIYKTVILSIAYYMSALAGSITLCRTITPAEFDRR
jgi:hypothetical protein